jgi:transcriptional regulator with XRE-family HTH domain
MDIRLQFGVRLRALRLSQRMTQERLAFRADMNVTFLSDLERGLNQPTLEKILMLSRALKLAPSELVDGLKLPRRNRKRKNKPGPKPSYKSKSRRPLSSE